MACEFAGSKDERASSHQKEWGMKLIEELALKGKLQGSRACSAGYNFRIIFEFVQYQGAESILVEAIEAHREVY